MDRLPGQRADARDGSAGDEVPGDEKITDAGRSDYAPEGAPGKANTMGTLKRLVKEISQDELTDKAAALTYYLVLAMFPALIALISIVGLVFEPQQIIDALTTLLNTIAPGTAADTFSGPIQQIAGSQSAAGFGLVIGIASALWAASGYVGAFTRAANVVWETPEGRPFWKLKPLQLLVTLIGVLLIAVIALSVVATGPITDAIGQALGLSSTVTTVWDIAKWPVMIVIVALMIAILYYTAPNVRLRGFKFVTVGAAAALLVWVIASALFAFYVANFGSYNKTYGALAGVIVFLVWLWITNLAVLIGIELDSERERTIEMKNGVERAREEIQLDARDDPKRKQTT
ncbi:YihY family inner membrane protein [Modestobacter sp. I12A-02628]|uniref:YihY/virulence factor BrkB family protein n=2 Tax=Goekera deserti TaxID=2497753 RepID=A0A7K3W909_9ACTN|nr:YihY family inner membrane protein [Goekera deserti]NDI49204.1 YihY family inner membrane protein [Goekera deserti]NEL52942.1 YihY/virulence factor BrkB family protein [Goekera deserti]